jgi:hypothetical protein
MDRFFPTPRALRMVVQMEYDRLLFVTAVFLALVLSAWLGALWLESITPTEHDLRF